MAEQAKPVDIASLPWPASYPTPQSVQAAILLAMDDLQKHATDTVWLTPAETVFERLAGLHSQAGGDPSELAKRWPQYFN